MERSSSSFPFQCSLSELERVVERKKRGACETGDSRRLDRRRKTGEEKRGRDERSARITITRRRRGMELLRLLREGSARTHRRRKKTFHPHATRCSTALRPGRLPGHYSPRYKCTDSMLTHCAGSASGGFGRNAQGSAYSRAVSADWVSLATTQTPYSGQMVAAEAVPIERGSRC